MKRKVIGLTMIFWAMFQSTIAGMLVDFFIKKHHYSGEVFIVPFIVGLIITVCLVWRGLYLFTNNFGNEISK